MSDQANSGDLTGPAMEGGRDAGDSQHGRGHGRRAVMVGAAAVGAGAVAAMASPAGAAMASPSQSAPKGAVQPTRSIVVRLPGSPMNIDQTLKILQTVLTQAGCGGCYSGWDISFIHEVEYFVNVDGGVQPGV
jgi:hypothetical protein